MAKEDSRSSTAAPPEVVSKFKAIMALTDAFCRQHLNEEYAEMCRRLALALARKQPSPLVRGRKEVWACGIVRTIGWANVLDDPKQSPHMKLIDIDPALGVGESTGQGKSMAIRRMFGIGRLNPDWTLPSRLGVNPLVWKVWIDDELVDVRQESRKQQEAAFQKGLIPYIPADRDEQTAEDEQPSMASAETDIFGSLFEFHQRVVALLRQSSWSDGKAKVLSDRIKLVIQNVTAEMKRSRGLDLSGRLESAYEEIQRLVEELSKDEQ